MSLEERTRLAQELYEQLCQQLYSDDAECQEKTGAFGASAEELPDAPTLRLAIEFLNEDNVLNMFQPPTIGGMLDLVGQTMTSQEAREEAEKLRKLVVKCIVALLS